MFFSRAVDNETAFSIGRRPVNGARLASAEETYAFVAALYEANQFSFDRLAPWLRSHVTQEYPG